MKTNLTLVLAIFAILSAATSYGAVVYDEASSGDLSGLFGTPTPLVLANGANTIIGGIGNNGNLGAVNNSGATIPFDADYFSFTVQPNASISSITIDIFTFMGSPDLSFFAYVAGSEFSGQAIGDIDGFVFFDAGSGDVLLGLAGGPLEAGTYSFWLQETINSLVDYQITFTQVPEPSAAMLFTLGLLGLFPRRGSLQRCIAE